MRAFASFPKPSEMFAGEVSMMQVIFSSQAYMKEAGFFHGIWQDEMSLLQCSHNNGWHIYRSVGVVSAATRVEVDNPLFQGGHDPLP